MAFFQFFHNLSFLHTHIFAPSLESLGTSKDEAPTWRCRRKIILHNFKLLTSITAGPAGIITGVRSATWKKDLTETWKSSKERSQDKSWYNYREFILTGKSPESRERTSIVTWWWAAPDMQCSYQSCILFRKQQGKKYSNLFARTFLNKNVKFMSYRTF